MLLYDYSRMLIGSMSYRLKTELVAVTREQDRNGLKVVKLEPGSIVRVGESEAKPHRSGLVDVSIGTEGFSVFIQDLEERAERI